MRLTRTGRTLVALSIALALTGCSKSTSPTSGTVGSADQLAVTSAAISTSGIVSDSLLDSTMPISSFSATPAPGGALAAIWPLYWWRTIRTVNTSFTYAFSDSDSTGRPRQADVVVTRHILGTLHVWKELTTDSTHADTSNVVRKPIDDTWVRYVRLRRMAGAGATENAWRVTAASLAKVNSPNTTEQIQSVRLQATGLDTTVTDPAALWHFNQLFHMLAGDSVTVTATTSHPDDVVLCYWHDRRERFHNNGDGTYSYRLRLPLLERGGERFIGVNALSHGTLFDDTLPYDSMAWVFHVFVGVRPAGSYY